jgi:predicted unusual protein kinase regulating ubiquinone biosynthesis (AarF/ABC1/UbiB family)
VKHIDADARIKYAKLILAIAEDDKEEICRVQFEDIGMVTRDQNPDVCYRISCFYNDRDTDDIMRGLNIQELVDECEATVRRPPPCLPSAGCACADNSSWQAG